MTSNRVHIVGADKLSDQRLTQGGGRTWDSALASPWVLLVPNFFQLRSDSALDSSTIPTIDDPQTSRRSTPADHLRGELADNFSHLRCKIVLATSLRIASVIRMQDVLDRSKRKVITDGDESIDIVEKLQCHQVQVEGSSFFYKCHRLVAGFFSSSSAPPP
ncbi:hypothetical protein PGTUg99_029420 [Puccinia graminis f. sp. tritici]|uniref:Uncharacterized protein n=1 Tax=Puccinia graminis f. sp. tritici TaxID=56615 RepID=A0A5B0MHF5_PUCGR|nr:hypothetical protein PGTUg99_029420 [Puccinia graminis f. sp. tritici]